MSCVGFLVVTLIYFVSLFYNHRILESLLWFNIKVFIWLVLFYSCRDYKYKFKCSGSTPRNKQIKRWCFVNTEPSLSSLCFSLPRPVKVSVALRWSEVRYEEFPTNKQTNSWSQTEGKWEQDCETLNTQRVGACVCFSLSLLLHCSPLIDPPLIIHNRHVLRLCEIHRVMCHYITFVF